MLIQMRSRKCVNILLILNNILTKYLFRPNKSVTK